MAAFPHLRAIQRQAMFAPLPNAPNKIFVPLINSPPGKICLVPQLIRVPPDLRRDRATRSE
jgi:hypothetical protein